jgi:hypothetical protein
MHDLQTLLGHAAAIFDWTCLGLHTGSQLAEHGQSKPKRFSLCSSPSGFLCPLLARSLSILRRAHALGVPSGYPIGVFGSINPGAFCFLTGNNIQQVMQAACLGAYPDASHCLRIHIKRLVSHSNRVAGAVALRALPASPSSAI